MTQVTPLPRPPTPTAISLIRGTASFWPKAQEPKIAGCLTPGLTSHKKNRGKAYSFPQSVSLDLHLRRRKFAHTPMGLLRHIGRSQRRLITVRIEVFRQLGQRFLQGNVSVSGRRKPDSQKGTRKQAEKLTGKRGCLLLRERSIAGRELSFARWPYRTPVLWKTLKRPPGHYDRILCVGRIAFAYNRYCCNF